MTDAAHESLLLFLLVEEGLADAANGFQFRILTRGGQRVRILVEIGCHVSQLPDALESRQIVLELDVGFLQQVVRSHELHRVHAVYHSYSNQSLLLQPIDCVVETRVSRSNAPLLANLQALVDDSLLRNREVFRVIFLQQSRCGVEDCLTKHF